MLVGGVEDSADGFLCQAWPDRIVHGDQFGLVSVISGDRSRANVMAVEDTICYLISKDKIVNLFHIETGKNITALMHQLLQKRPPEVETSQVSL